MCLFSIRIQNIIFSAELMGFEENDHFVHDLSNSFKRTSNFLIYRLFCICRNLFSTDAKRFRRGTIGAQTPTSKICDFYRGFRAQEVLSPQWKETNC